MKPSEYCRKLSDDLKHLGQFECEITLNIDESGNNVVPSSFSTSTITFILSIGDDDNV